MTHTSNYLSVLDREIHYCEWGAGNREVVIAWHGLARTGRDMDDIAAQLAKRYRVICPDTIGRGLSQWSPKPEQEYSLDFYCRLAVGLADALGVDTMHWLGTSMGGAIGIRLAARALKGRIRRLVVNDIGPQLGEAAVQRIRDYAGKPPAFERVSELEQFFRTVYAPFGWLSDAQWRRLTETSTRRLPDGRVTPHYDPKMVLQFELYPGDYLQWDAYRAIEAPVLCLRGETSDLLLPEVADAMRTQGPRAVVVEIAGCGHAPALNVPEQYALVERFLDGG